MIRFKCICSCTELNKIEIYLYNLGLATIQERRVVGVVIRDDFTTTGPTIKEPEIATVAIKRIRHLQDNCIDHKSAILTALSFDLLRYLTISPTTLVTETTVTAVVTYQLLSYSLVLTFA